MAQERLQIEGRMTALSRVGWMTLALLAMVIGLVSLRYVLPHVPFPAGLPNFRSRHGWLIGHAVFSSIALLTGVWQFSSSLRRSRIGVHRWMGRVYCVAVLLGWLTSIPIAMHANFGAIPSAGFLALGAAWIVSTACGYFTIRRGEIALHRQWMMRSYALTAAAITLRLYLPVFPLMGMSFATSYRLIAWLCWVPNLLLVEWMIQRQRMNAAAR
jgi:uncharacterized membrane protein